MSDKSFGDYSNKNIVKNPLLSSAVTGLSLEDLTHNAVLLPVAQSQGLITKQDYQSGSQIVTLAHTANTSSNTSFTSSNIANAPPTTNPLSHQNVEKTADQSRTTVSKASDKTDDDFDVNEYFARLQGTRYVSAPLNTLTDPQADLQATEENLEEVNLNEPEKEASVEVQQSITADIAQNFSQLPTVLPQVASAVFSSFSNMLSYKSREQTPDGRLSTGYQEVDTGRGSVVPVASGVELSANSQKDMAPPPREPPIGGTSNFRINTRKKTYAPFPGLSSNNVPVQNLDVRENPIGQQASAHLFNPNDTYQQVPIAVVKDVDKTTSNDQTVPKDYNIFNPMESQDVAQVPVKKEPTFYDVKNTEANTDQVLPVMQDAGNAQQSGIIPPPPMFSNLTRRDSVPSVGKAILPPSVARRIGANQPIIRTQIQSQTFATENIFMPPPLTDSFQNSTGTDAQAEGYDAPKSEDAQVTTVHSAFVQFKSTYSTVSNHKTYDTLLSDAHHRAYSHSQHPIFAGLGQNAPAPPQNEAPLSISPGGFALPDHMTLPPTFNPANISTVNMKVPLPSDARSPNIAETISTVFYDQVNNSVMLPTSSNNMTSNSPSEPQSSVQPFFNPSIVQTPTNTAVNADLNMPPSDQYFGQSVSTADVGKPVPEPPKVTGVSYRMTKKRPQYYSGPIEGVGAISNNVKPVIPSVETRAFEGALFTPDQQKLGEQQVPSEPASVPFDISKPAELTSSYTSFAITSQINNQAQSYVQPDYSTAFDLSRPRNESFEQTNYEPPKQESTGFGIIGSLKSKLGAIDINKIQNSVTSFFDPAYNDTKKEPTNNQANVPYQYAQGNVNTAITTQERNLEIYVPNVEAYGQSYNSQVQYQNIYSNAYGFQNYDQSVIHYSDQQCGPHKHHNYTNDPCLNSQYSYRPITSPDNQELASSSVGGQNHNSNYISQLSGNDNIPKDQAHIYQDASESNQHINSENLNVQVVRDTQRNLFEYSASQVTNNVSIPSSIDINYNAYNLFANEGSAVPVDAFGQNIDSVNNNEQINTGEAKLDTVSAQHFFDNQQPQTEAPKSDFIDNFRNLELSSESLLAESIDNKPILTDNSFSQSCTVSGETMHTNEQCQIDKTIDYHTDILGSETKHFVQDYFGCSLTKSKDLNIGADNTNVSQIKSEIAQLISTEEPIAMSSVPLFGLSNILAEKTKEMSDLQSETIRANIEDIIEDESNNVNFIQDSTAEIILPSNEQNDGISELSICETCREIEKPDEKEVEGLTGKLIENITSPIQLSNPVVAPFAVTNVPISDRTDFDIRQCEEISHITEETIEAIQGQSATELLKDADAIIESDYGWSTKGITYSEATVDHTYTFQVDPTSLGFYGSNSMFFENIPNNASDELKAEFKSSQEDTPSILPSQMSIPSAPPAEDDDETKSDETGGLDVHSIEQDAKKDFPIYEEFVIEPSETDYDKIEYRERERSSEDPVQELDSFTNRVEKFKQMEETVDRNDEVLESQKNIFDITTSTSPAMTIASYFDTGNYAVEAHYRNSLTSPSVVPYPVSSPETAMRVPPGFEDEYKKRMGDGALQDPADKDSNTDKINTPYIPETSTQTRMVTTTTFSNVSNLAHTITTSPKTEQTNLLTEQLPNFPSVLSRGHEAGDALASSLFSNAEVKKETTPFLIGTPDNKIETPKVPLPDPISFLSAGQENTEDKSFNRLASYFQSPAKTDHGKSFFELSQSQNHYRHASHRMDNEKGNRIAQNTKDVNDFFTSTQNHSHTHNIPSDVYIANLKLMHDLTSIQNIAPNKDQTVTSVNYFTVEYDNGEIKPNIKVHQKIHNNDYNSNDNAKSLEETKSKDTDDSDEFLTAINKCVYCCNIETRIINKIELDRVDFKFKKAMDTKESGRSGVSPTARANEDLKKDVTVNLQGSMDEENDGVAILTENRGTTEYTPVKHHWFYRVDFEGTSIWRGFSASDNQALEEAYHSPDLNENTLVATDGGRFDVNVLGRLRIAVYWPAKPTNVRRCSWFYKGTTDARYVPYTEPVAEKLEEEYRHGISTGEWHRRLVLPNGESVVMHGPTVMVHFPQPVSDGFGSTPQSGVRPRVVRRGRDESEIEDAEPSRVDHLLLLCHGVGSACDMRFRSVEEVVDDFRATSLQLLQSHYRNSYDKGVVNRVEVLPISWHSTLHSGETGVDRRLAAITLDSIPKLRNFTNDTVLDVLFYTSPVFCQTIIDTVCAELNRIYNLFVRRNPSFAGGVSLGGHSLGSVILYDLLCHQQAKVDTGLSKSFVAGPAGTGQPTVRYPALDFEPAALYALGSPIAMFECIRGVKSLGADFSLPTCKNFFNIFHPYDPIAYRIEPLINPQLGNVKPYLIPHHKGRKRMHLELKETMARVGADLKQKLIESLKATWSSMWKTQPPPNDGQLEKVVEEEMEKEQLCEESKEEVAVSNDVTTPAMLGRLNGGRRVDYVLQEAPFEMINEYLFAMSSHVCYWESEDTMLLMLREMYEAVGVPPDGTVPQHTMTVHRTRTPRPDESESLIMDASEHPSTSRGDT